MSGSAERLQQHERRAAEYDRARLPARPIARSSVVWPTEFPASEWMCLLICHRRVCRRNVSNVTLTGKRNTMRGGCLTAALPSAPETTRFGDWKVFA